MDLEQQAALTKRAFKESLKTYLNQFNEFTDTPDMSVIVQAMKPVIFQEAMGVVSDKKYVVAQVLGVSRSVLAKTLKEHPSHKSSDECHYCIGLGQVVSNMNKGIDLSDC
ncbi:hypothetical protein [Vibrio paucivorans]|uniref:Uncharacterized protein n=1 Tax=Vibrio paucivorans TaxID=2829489 RepID=A0A9X3HTS5_9VIBR|nr:hypothetical protein [Vibrio paucivorans]MCW8336115.1 hypothetical protein [Vibrio paucivorans]